MVWGSHKTLRYWHHQLELSSSIIIGHSHIRKVSTKALFVVTDFRTHILDHRDMCFRSPIWIILKYHVNVFWELLLVQSPPLFLNKIKKLTQWRDCSLDIQLHFHYHPIHPSQNSISSSMLEIWHFSHYHIFEVCLACCQLVRGSNFIVHSEKTLRLTGGHPPPSDYD